MNNFQQRLIYAAALLVGGLISHPTFAGISPYAPDAWSRGNDANTSYFGWDVMDRVPDDPDYGPLWILDDATPDLGTGITATGTRAYQGADGIVDPLPTSNGHVSSTGNYYTFFDTSNDNFTATAPASGSGGFTTVVMQVLENFGGDGIADLQFAMDNTTDTWTPVKQLHNLTGSGRAVHWVEWTAPGDNLTFSINMTSTDEHRVVDSFQIDTFWTPDGAPAINAITSVPEPASWLLALGGLMAAVWARRGTPS